MRPAIWLLLLASAAILPSKLRASETADEIQQPLLGRWVISRVEGSDPALLEVATAHDLVGRHVTFSRDHVALWSVYGGHPIAWHRTMGSLAGTLSVPASIRNTVSVADADALLEMTQISLDSCTDDGKPVAACPAVIIARNPGTGDVSLVTYPFGLAHLQRIHGAGH